MRLSLLLVSTLVLACADQSAIVLELDSDLAVPDEADQARIEVLSESGALIAQRLLDLPGGWPQTFVILPGDDTAGASVLVRVTAVLAGSERLRRVVRAQFVEDAEVRIRVELFRACLDVTCTGELNDCVEGICVGEPPPLEDSGTPMDSGTPDTGGPDGGFDAGVDSAVDAGMDSGSADVGMPDAGPGDAGPIDVGPPDTGPPDTGPPDVGPPDVGVDSGPTGGLFFSEYQEGPSGFGNNKLLELYNGGPPIDLSTCVINLYTNGSGSPSDTSTMLSGTLPTGGLYVVCDTGLSDAVCDAHDSVINHNGDDAYDLVCAGVTQDTFGQIGNDPGAFWSGGGVETRDTTLRRRCSVNEGDPNGADAFDPSVQWEATDDALDLSGFGSRGC